MSALTVLLVCQPPNSPDLNVLDLGFFRAIQTLQEKKRCTTIDGLIDATLTAWNDVEPTTLNANFLTLQTCLVEVIRAGGNKNYKKPHMGKAKLLREGRLPDSIVCPREVVEHGQEIMNKEDFDLHVSLLAAKVARDVEMAVISSSIESLCLANNCDDDKGKATKISAGPTAQKLISPLKCL
ncbi:hypothetical protein H257_06975 [Aphanomyces astaci]|uniref:Uncharacterized protein n=1 Tax=Aphanomyces astaci TaxID=112090 RepID=W4GJ72_APHAT|nr:hypothetical protein H257_06975 [Aphanomyces astaci]ETV79737.1 hypothetical protein H257_06975 [Aphanomyces astaci]|eukprot:XP_009830673.1 hypothetical protein H257_06975 [Aphanomyces astaci]